MKKYIVMCAALAVAISFTSCKSSESAYKKAYEKALQQETAQNQHVEQIDQIVIEEVPVIEETTAPVTTNRSYNETTIAQNDFNTTATPTPATPVNTNVKVREENVTLVSGSGLKAYSVVVGSFGVKANAERLQSILRGNGYDAQVVSSGSMYRVVASTSDSKDSSVSSRNALLSAYPDAWLLYKK